MPPPLTGVKQGVTKGRMKVELAPYPGTSSDAVTRIEVAVVRVRHGIPGLAIRWRAEGDLSRLAMPPPIKGRADGLWRSTCFEAFIRIGDEEDYLELNVSPSDGWATYAFDSCREGMRPSVEPMAVERWKTADHVGAEADLDLDAVFGRRHRGRPVCLGLSAVVQDVDGGVSYWALAHPSDKPDFHHPAAFILSVPEPA